MLVGTWQRVGRRFSGLLHDQRWQRCDCVDVPNTVMMKACFTQCGKLTEWLVIWCCWLKKGIDNGCDGGKEER